VTPRNRRIDRILDPAYLEGLADAPLERLRAMRDECSEEEAVLSYERRLLHARLDMLAAEAARRADGGSPRAILDRLPSILAGEGPPGHRGAFPRLAPPPLFDPPRRRVERLVSDDTLARLPDLSDEELHRVRRTLEEAEREVSAARRAVQRVLDRVAEELARRVAADV
jgi:hypothetical protein